MEVKTTNFRNHGWLGKQIEASKTSFVKVRLLSQQDREGH